MLEEIYHFFIPGIGGGGGGVGGGGVGAGGVGAGRPLVPYDSEEEEMEGEEEGKQSVAKVGLYRVILILYSGSGI